MTLRKIVEVRKRIIDNSLRELIERLARREDKLIVQGLDGAARAFVTAMLFRHLGCPITVIRPDRKEAEKCLRDLTFFLGEEQALMLPPWELVTTDMFAFQRETELARMEALQRYAYGVPAVVVMPVSALMQKTVPRDILEGYVETISIGDLRGRDELTAKLSEGGYVRESLVEGKGEFSVRGDILDIFPPHAAHPLRLEFFGDEIESIRLFDEATQRSIEEIADFTLFPAAELIITKGRRERAVRAIRRRSNELGLPRTTKEKLAEIIATGLGVSTNPLFYSLFYNESGDEGPGDEGMGTLFDYLPPGGILMLDDPLADSLLQEKIENDLDGFFLKAREQGRFYLEKEAAYLSAVDVSGRRLALTQLYFTGLALGAEAEGNFPILFHLEEDISAGRPEAQRAAEDEGVLFPLAQKMRGWLDEGNAVAFICSGQEGVERTAQLLGRYDVPTRKTKGRFIESIEAAGPAGVVTILEGRISGGFHLPGMKLIVLSEEEIFGKKALRRPARRVREGYFLKSFGELSEGDFVVHTEHGIGRYQGLQKLAAGGVENDFLLIEYQGNDRLYIPVDRIDQLQRYIGAEGFVPKVDKLGGISWETMKEKVRESVREMAEELVAIYAARETMEREPFAPPDRLYEEFCAAFEFDETPDQAKAIEDIHLDMNGAKPMDRLICGDAGFGKTEVAMRASFRAALNGKQVAMLVPTTILAEQHYQTFSGRMKNYPLRVEVLNRFRSKAEQKEISEGLAKGTVDIVIGTHRLLQKDVNFRDLGLVIVDEEQRFGVADKEKLKKLRKLVDVVTLSATPIPRTLHLSLVGIRDLSIMNTPPESRLPVKTYVIEFNEEIITDAIRGELARGGRVFFLHDRVRSIFTMARLIQKLVPEANIGIVHGQMKPSAIEGAMKRFIRGEDNVLVCTTIIGAGLDIPSANTIIINRADRFGLSQLYQIRGRVGRSKEEAFAWLLVPQGAMLSRDAQKRLQVIMDFTEAGSGYRIASNDLEIRGAGNMLGTSQSGHVSAVGYELYTEMMEDAIREIKGAPAPEEELRPEINLGIPAFIPETYMADEHQRLVWYKKISLALTEEELYAIRQELRDCYGNVPAEVDNLMGVIEIRNLLKTVRGRKMGYDGKDMSLLLQDNSPIEPALIMKLYRGKRRGVHLTPDNKLTISMPGIAGSEILSRARELIGELRG
ncbi:MAG: transcription-repair coupling factor [Syntrophobacterales bacterium]|nr:transcription-repair coupling factor [Syntrophobacterales bacterium]